MNVNRSNGPNAPGSPERYREAMDAFVQRTRFRLAQARHIASRLAEIRKDHAAQVEERLAEVELPNLPSQPNTERPERKDKVDISEGMQTQAREAQNADDGENVRPKVARLKHAYRMNKLFREELFEKAAHHMLRRMEAAGPNDGEANAGEAGDANLDQGPTKPGSVKHAKPATFAPYGSGGSGAGAPNTSGLPNTGGVPNLPNTGGDPNTGDGPNL